MRRKSLLVYQRSDSPDCFLIVSWDLINCYGCTMWHFLLFFWKKKKKKKKNLFPYYKWKRCVTRIEEVVMFPNLLNLMCIHTENSVSSAKISARKFFSICSAFKKDQVWIAPTDWISMSLVNLKWNDAVFPATIFHVRFYRFFPSRKCSM